MSPLERDWSTKPIIYIINNSLAFRYVTSQIWKYYGIFGFVPNERGRIHEHKAPFCKQLSAQAFKVYSIVSLCERRIQNQHVVTVWGLCFQVCISWPVLPTNFQGKLLKEGWFVAKWRCDVIEWWHHCVIMTQNCVTTSNLSKKYILYMLIYNC